MSPGQPSPHFRIVGVQAAQLRLNRNRCGVSLRCRIKFAKVLVDISEPVPCLSHFKLQIRIVRAVDDKPCVKSLRIPQQLLPQFVLTGFVLQCGG